MSTTRPAKWNTLIEVMQIKRVRVYLHWSVLLIGAIILLNALKEPFVTFVSLACYIGVILIHECGHMIAAQRKGCRVWSIELYPFWGITRFDEPYSRWDHCAIAWGGVLAQGVVAIPLVVWVEVFGFTRFPALNAVLGILGFYSVLVALFNLLPIRPLDGAIAWSLVPLIFRRSPPRSSKREPGWRSWK